MIRIMHVLYTGNNYVAKDNFSLCVEIDNKGILLLFIVVVAYC